jgi:hypothetical protein
LEVNQLFTAGNIDGKWIDVNSAAVMPGKVTASLDWAGKNINRSAGCRRPFQAGCENANQHDHNQLEGALMRHKTS